MYKTTCPSPVGVATICPIELDWDYIDIASSDDTTAATLLPLSFDSSFDTSSNMNYSFSSIDEHDQYTQVVLNNRYDKLSKGMKPKA